MYAYDAALQDRRYERDVALLETRLTDLGITGKILRLALFRDALPVLREEIRMGAKTLVAVGNDETLRKVIEAVGDARVVVAYVPIFGNNPMADLLGLPQGAGAADMLSARLVEEMDLGEVNGKRFLHRATLSAGGVSMVCEDAYTVTPLRRGTIEIRNLAAPDDAGYVSPSDERLTCIIRLPRFSFFKKKEDISKIPFRHARLFVNGGGKMDIDGVALEGSEFDIRVIPARLHIVTGKGRKYAPPSGVGA